MLDMINDFFQVGKNAFHVKCKKNWDQFQFSTLNHYLELRSNFKQTSKIVLKTPTIFLEPR